MSRNLKIKAAILAAFVIVSVVVMGFVVANMQDDISLKNYTADIQAEMDELPALLQSADEESAQNTQTFDEIYASKAESVAFLANNNTGFEATDAKMLEYKDLLSVDNVLVVDRAGTVVAKAQDTPANFAYARFNQLRSVFDTGEPSAAMEVSFAETGQTFRYYAARIDDNTMAVIEQNPEELDQLIENSGSQQSILKNLSVGQTGYVMAVSGRDYTVTYHPPNADLVGHGRP